MPDTPTVVAFVGFCEQVRERIRGGEGDRETVLWRCSRHGVRSGQGGLRVLDMELKSGWFPAVFGGAMMSMGRTLEKLGPKRLFTRVRGRGILRSWLLRA